jgi:hypothetical protein
MKLSEMTKHEGGRYHDGNLYLPWYTSPCLEWLMTLDFVGKRVFEYGLGDSTLWYRSKGAESFGVDDNIEWCLKVGSIDKGYECSKFQYEYITSVVKYTLLDFIIIDGIYRDDCTDYALNALKPGGYLIIDNFEQPSVEEFWPLTRKLIEGMPIVIYKEPNHYDWQTVVIQKPE